MDELKCLICGEPTCYDGVQHFRRTTRWFRCDECDFAQVDPMPSTEELSRYYASGEYRREMYRTSPQHKQRLDMIGPTPLDLDAERQRGESWLRYLRPARRHLDIGSSIGTMIDLYADALDIEESVGVEPGLWGRGYGAYRDLSEVEGTFDLVTCFHVLEHVPDPMSFLRQIKPLVTGQLAVEVPANQRVWPHVTAWAYRSAQKAMGLAGLPAKLVDLHSHLKLLHDKELHK